MLQFNKSQKNGHDIEMAFVCGLSDFGFNICQKYVKDLDVEARKLNEYSNFIQCSNKKSKINISDYILNLGCIVRK